MLNGGKFETEGRQSFCCADPVAIGKNDNVFGLLPVTAGLKTAAWLMVVHQVGSSWEVNCRLFAQSMERKPEIKGQDSLAMQLADTCELPVLKSAFPQNFNACAVCGICALLDPSSLHV